MPIKDEKEMPAVSAVQKEMSLALMEFYDNIVQMESILVDFGSDYNLSISEIHAIVAVGAVAPPNNTLSGVASQLKVRPPSATAMMTKLSHKGYVQRVRSQQDRRMVLIELTRKGRYVYLMYRRFHLKMVRELLQDMNESDSHILLFGLRKLRDFFAAKVREEEAVRTGNK